MALLKLDVVQATKNRHNTYKSLTSTIKLFKMKTFKALLVLLSALMISPINGQNTEQMLISSAGETLVNANVNINFSVGEISVETTTGSNVILTQGFHQTTLSVTEVLEVGSEDKIEVYPNPAQEYLNIKFSSDYGNLGYARIYTLIGNMVFEERILPGETIKHIDLREVQTGQYLLVISSENDDILNSYRIVKLN